MASLSKRVKGRPRVEAKMQGISSRSLESSGRDDSMAGTGLSVGAIQGVARRQLVGSIVVAIFIAAVAGLAAMKPARTDAIASPSHGFAVVQQPVFTTPPSHHIAAAKSAAEVP
jgi:hypothetical protein